MSLDYTHTLPGNGDEGDAFEHWNCRLCAYWQAWWDAQEEHGHTPQSCNVFCRAMAGEEAPEIVCAEVPGAWPYGRAWQCRALELWRIPIPPESEREQLREEEATSRSGARARQQGVRIARRTHGRGSGARGGGWGE